MFLSQARGKVGSVVFSVLKGQQIERVYNPKPENPRSYSQQAQRALLANATKLYKRAISNFYKFAFEDKTRYESDYNAFAKHNVMRGAYVPKDLYENPYFPALGDFVMSRGSLVVDAEFKFNGGMFGMVVSDGFSTSSTVGQLSSALISSNIGLQQGDILTFVLGYSSVTVFGVSGDLVPTWKVVQIILDPTDSRTLGSLGLSTSENNTVGLNVGRDDVTGFGAVVFSRKTPDGLKVSDTVVVPNAAWAVLTEWYRGTYAKVSAARSWGALDEAILEGALALRLPTVTSFSFGASSIAPYAPVNVVLGPTNDYLITINGARLRTSAQGANYVLKLYNLADLNSGPNPQYLYEIPYTVTGSSTSVQGNPAASPSAPAGTYLFVLTIDDEPISYGSVNFTPVS